MVLFPYTALNEDELSLSEGQIVSIITKDVEDKVCCNLKITALWNVRIVSNKPEHYKTKIDQNSTFIFAGLVER